MCLCACTCVYVHLFRMNFVTSASFLQSSEKLSFYLFLTPQIFEWQLVQFIEVFGLPLFIQMLRTMYSFSVAGMKQGLKAPFPALPLPPHPHGPQAWFAVQPSVHLAIHSSIPVILRGLQHLGLREWVTVWSRKNTDFANVFDKMSFSSYPQSAQPFLLGTQVVAC